MDKDQMNEVFQGVVNDKFDAVVGKMVEKDGKYMFEGVALNKYGQTVAKITYVSGIIALAYVGGKIGSKIGEKIANKIHQRRLRKAKAEAFDEMVEILEQARKDLEQKENQDESKGKHFKDEESE